MQGNTPAYAGKTHAHAGDPRPRRKHPRLRGEDAKLSHVVANLLETPPLTRGRPGVSFGVLDSIRNTPAYAGKTHLRSQRASTPEKHPRLRGEDSHPLSSQLCPAETPPLTRGRPLSFDTVALCGRKHPRLRGEDAKTIRRREACWKHPRLRGEDEVGCISICQAQETPPLTRGRPTYGYTSKGLKRNTPAYAGKTSASSISFLLDEKHPRLRGEDKSVPFQAVFVTETPPLTRGRRVLQVLISEPLGNTPAYAGKTIGLRLWRGMTRETPPLTRGRQLQGVDLNVEFGNTPAYAGKTGRRWQCVKRWIGNTPAYAGKTVLRRCINIVIKKHPRLRGEDLPFSWMYPSSLETPPLTRGRPTIKNVKADGVRNTPAYAGKTWG